MVEAQTPWFGDGLCTSGDHEKGLLEPFYHCWCPGGGGVFLSSHNKIHDTQAGVFFPFFENRKFVRFLLHTLSSTDARMASE